MVLWELMLLCSVAGWIVVKFNASNLIIRHEAPKNSCATTILYDSRAVFVEFSPPERI